MLRQHLGWGSPKPGAGCCGCALGCLGNVTVVLALLILLVVFVACAETLGG